jgi:hypothetical protein
MTRHLLSLIPLGLLVASCGPQGMSVPSISNPLKPQAYTWYPERSVSGPVLVFDSIPRQEAVVYRNGIRIGRAAVSTGKPGHSTPTGVFQILQKDVDHHSSGQKMQIYQNGRKMAESAVEPSGSLRHFKGEAVFLFARDNQWHTVKGHASFSNVKNDLHVSDAFRNKIRAVVLPGTTMIITSEPVTPRGVPSRDVISVS